MICLLFGRGFFLLLGTYSKRTFFHKPCIFLGVDVNRRLCCFLKGLENFKNLFAVADWKIVV
jgi:hypothetical protein